MQSMGRPVVLVSCVKSKHSFPCAAKDLYCSTLFMAQREFAEAVSERWFILSAKYHLVDPDQVIAPYEQTLNDASVAEKKDWSKTVCAQLDNKIGESEKIIITAGQNYCRYLIPLLKAKGHEVEEPLKGLRMGYRSPRLRELTG